jgi:peptidoglycan/LPS O-acetylase OafA/YrhL
MDELKPAARVGAIVRFNDAVLQKRWRPAVAFVLALLLVVAGFGWTEPRADDPHHGPHALTAGPHNDPAVITDHAHFENGSTPVSPDTYADAVRPRATVVLLALGLLTAMAAVAVFYRGAPPALIRGPPRGVGEALTGRVLLTLLCIARR